MMSWFKASKSLYISCNYVLQNILEKRVKIYTGMYSAAILPMFLLVWLSIISYAAVVKAKISDGD